MMTGYLYNLATDRVGGVFAFFVKVVLWILSLVYGAVVFILARIYFLKPAVLSCRMISIGNITWGGTGKTPLVEALANMLKADGRKVAILTRGYKRDLSGKPAGQAADASSMGDEPYMLSRKLQGVPVIVNSDRVKAGIEAIKAHGVDTLILDDGFQQWRIKKDLEIVTIDAGNPFGNGCLIPRGILREPLIALKRAHVFVLTNADTAGDITALKARISRINPSALIVEARHKPVGFYALKDPSKQFDAGQLRLKPAAIVCAIGNPDSFRRLVQQMQIQVLKRFVFPDHHRYSEDDMRFIAAESARNNIRTIITTEKDSGKLQPLAADIPSLDIYVLQVALEMIDHEEQFNSRLRSLYTA
jgi:tetraacyldisaccharide 4'-kinase